MKAARMPRRPPYKPPTVTEETTVATLIAGRSLSRQGTLPLADDESEAVVYYAGDLSLASLPAVAIVGSRKVSEAGARRARRLARELAKAGVVVTSGLAEGVDFNAHTAAIEAGGRSIAVLGTPLDTAYPARNARLQERLWADHLVVSQFPNDSRVFKANFPTRNRLMAAMTDATVIIEASDTSGTLHQAIRCVKLERPLFIAKSIVDNDEITWPGDFLKYDTVSVLENVSDLLAVLPTPQNNS